MTVLCYKNHLKFFFQIKNILKNCISILNKSKMLGIRGVLVEVFAYPIYSIWKKKSSRFNNPFHYIAP